MIARNQREVRDALSQIDDRWDGERTERTLQGLAHKRRRARLRAQTGAGAVLCFLLGVSWFALERSATPATVATKAPASSPQGSELALRDGSGVRLDPARAEVRVVREDEREVSLDLIHGSARFDVTPKPTRFFRVRSGEVTVEVLGTSFELERDGDRTHVTVTRGRVAVLWPNGRTELGAGEAGWFPRSEVADEPARVEATRRERARAPLPKASGKRAASWRDAAEQGDFERAYSLIDHQRPAIDDVEELLLAADSARLSGHPEAALPFLRRVVDEHSKDSRASLAAFTLGGVLMQQLGQPREAESAYARARQLSLNSSLAEDALARQVEAAFRGGDAAQARALASEYVARYPSGRRLRAVQRFGQLSP